MFNKLLSGLGQALKILKPVAYVLRTVWRWVNPAADTAQAAFLRQIALSIVRAWVAEHPKQVADILKYADVLVNLLQLATPVTAQTARTVIMSAIQEVEASAS